MAHNTDAGKKGISNGGLLSIIIVVCAAVVFFANSQQSFGFFGYGYGYGYGECTFPGPAVTNVNRISSLKVFHFAWSRVHFSDCGLDSDASRYRLEVYKISDSSLVWSGPITTNEKNIPYTIFNPHTRYKFRVRAFAADGTPSRYSDWVTFNTNGQ